MAARARPGAPVVMESNGSSAKERADVRPLIFPRSAALIGVSPRTDPEAVDNAVGKGIPVVAVHPRETIAGLETYTSIAEVPWTPELAFMLVGHRRVEAAFDEALAAGVRTFVIPGLGNEAGAEGGVVAERIAQRAYDVGAAVIGPNCMGVAVPGAASFWIGTIPPTFLAGHVSAVVQSGSVGEALLAIGPRVGFRCVISSGGELVTDVAEYCRFFAADDGTKAVCLFSRIGQAASCLRRLPGPTRICGKPVVCLQGGTLAGRGPGGPRAQRSCGRFRRGLQRAPSGIWGYRGRRLPRAHRGARGARTSSQAPRQEARSGHELGR